MRRTSITTGIHCDNGFRPPKEPRFLPYLRMVTSSYRSAWGKYLFTDPDTPFLLRGPLPPRDVPASSGSRPTLAGV